MYKLIDENCRTNLLPAKYLCIGDIGVIVGGEYDEHIVIGVDDWGGTAIVSLTDPELTWEAKFMDDVFIRLFNPGERVILEA